MSITRSIPIEQKIKYRGIVSVNSMIEAIQKGDRVAIRSTIQRQRSGFMFSFWATNYQLHAVDRFALYPLFYTVKRGELFVSQDVDELLPYLDGKILHPEGFYGTGGIGKGHRTPYTPFVNIMRIPPGHFLEYRDGRHELVRYWSPYEGSYKDACDRLGTLIKQAVDRCYQHSSQLAVHLSGGLDSGSITALLAQMKADTIHAYARVKPDAPDNHPTYENGYVAKYVKHYPQIKLYKAHELPFVSDHRSIERSAADWNCVHHEGPEGQICNDLSAKQIPYILSGVGGDELASYGHPYQATKLNIDSQASARRFMFQQIFLKRRLRRLIKGVIGLDGKRVDSVLHTMMTPRSISRNKNYHPAFRDAVRDLREGNKISLYRLPSTYKYRLETLEKSYFTIRADNWNFISRNYGVDYLFPLLDADLVEFCASLPRHFFIGKPQRQMIKTGLRKYLPEELLDGAKRPTYQSAQEGGENTVSNFASLAAHRLDQIQNLEDTLASKVYDLNYIKKQILQYQKRMNWLPNGCERTRQTLLNVIELKRLYFRHADYVNAHFDDISY